MPCRWSHTRLRTKPAAMHQSGRAIARAARSSAMACGSRATMAAMSFMSATAWPPHRKLQDDAGEDLEGRHARSGLHDRILRLDEDVHRATVRALEHAAEAEPHRHHRIEPEIERRDAGRAQVVAAIEIEEQQGLD